MNTQLNTTGAGKNPLIQFAAWLCVFVAGMAGFSSAYAQKSHDVTRFDVAGVKLGMNYQNAKTAAAAYFGTDNTELVGEECIDKLSADECRKTVLQPAFEAASKKCEALPVSSAARDKCRHEAGQELGMLTNRREYDPDNKIKWVSIVVVPPNSQKEPVYPVHFVVTGYDGEIISVEFPQKDSRVYRNGYAMHNNVMNVTLSFDSKLTKDAVVKKYGSPSVENSGSFGVSLEWCPNPVKKKDGRYTCKTKPPQNIMTFVSLFGTPPVLTLTHKYYNMSAAGEKAFKSGKPLEPQ